MKETSSTFSPTVVAITRTEATIDEIRPGLQEYGHPVFQARSASEAKRVVPRINPRYVVLDEKVYDASLDDYPGRQVIIVSNNDDSIHKAKAIEAGAETYLTKGWIKLIPQLVHAMDQRENPNEKKEIEVFGLRVDPSTKTISFNGNLIPLMKGDFDYFDLLLRSEGYANTYSGFRKGIGRRRNGDSNTGLRMAMSRIRKELKDSGVPLVIKNVPKTGYKVTQTL